MLAQEGRVRGKWTDSGRTSWRAMLDTNGPAACPGRDVGQAVRPSVEVHKRGGVTIRDKGERRMNDVRGI